MRLTKQEREILQGKHGEAKRLALTILAEFGELFDAPELIEVSQAHLDSSLYILDVGLEFIEHFAELEAQVAVPTSLNVGAIDLQRWQKYRVPDELLNKCRDDDKGIIEGKPDREQHKVTGQRGEIAAYPSLLRIVLRSSTRQRNYSSGRSDAARGTASSNAST